MSARAARLNPGAVRRRLEEGVREHRENRFEAAARCYAAVLASEPHNVDALHLLALAERERGHLEVALKYLQQVVQRRPAFAPAFGNLGLVLQDLARTDEAIAAYQRALTLDPELVEPRFNLANLWRAQGQIEAALNGYREALKRQPLAAVWRNYAGLLLHAGQPAAAIEAYRATLKFTPEDPELWNSLGSALQAMRELSEAITCHHRATQLAPDYAEAHNNLGNALKDFRHPAQALGCYRRALELKPELVPAWNNLGIACLELGRVEDAMSAFRQALKLAPEFAEAHLNLGNVLKRRGQAAQAIYYYNQALAFKPDLVQAHNNLGVVLTEQGEHGLALAHLETALTLDPTFAEAHNNLGNIYKNQARLTDAVQCFSRALELCPDYSGAHSNLLFTLNFIDGISASDIFNLHRDFNTRHAVRFAAAMPPPANSKDPTRRLKIGYLSPDFRAHACAFFVEPIFKHHNRSAVEVYAYAEVVHPDAVTRRLQGLVETWRSTVGLNDEQVAALIRADEIDIVIDLAGHTANGRLLALARKPAPIQITYLGYPATTGLDVIDYRLTDAVTEPVGTTEAFYTEELLRLPHSLWCYQPYADMPAVAPSPAMLNGYLTFASFNSYTKIGPRVIALWARVLAAVPQSRLVMITVPTGDAQTQLRAEFARLGIDPARLVLHDRLLRHQYLDLFSQVDVALDPFPCNGGTTTCDALWMGVPVVSLIGATFLSRASYSLLVATELTAYAAADDDRYVEICVDAANHPGALAALRAGMRARLQHSPLLDATGFIRDLEAVYRAVWQRWCAQ